MVLTGAALFGAHLLHATDAEENVRSIAFGVAVPMALSLGTVVAGGWLLRTRDEDRAPVTRVGLWCVGGAAVLAVGAGMTVLYQDAEGVAMSDVPYVLVNAASLGAATGVVVGVYDRRRHTVQRRLADRRRRLDRRNRQLTVLNRVLRHDIRNGADAIRGYARLIVEGETPEEFARTIRDRADDLVAIGEDARAVEDLLEDDPDRRTVDLAATADAASDRVESRSRASRVDPGTDTDTDIDGDGNGDRDPDDRAATSDEDPGLRVDRSIPEESVPVRAHPALPVAAEAAVERAADWSDADAVVVDCRDRPEGGELRVDPVEGTVPEADATAVERGYETPTDHTDGLGLWLAAWVVEESGGDLVVDDDALLARLPAPDDGGGEATDVDGRTIDRGPDDPDVDQSAGTEQRSVPTDGSSPVTHSGEGD